MNAPAISDERLLASLVDALRDEGKLIARIVLGLCEVKERRLHLAYGYSSLFEFCVHHLKMTEGQAFYRTATVKLACLFPQIHAAIRDSRVSITNLVLLRDLFREDNVDDLLTASIGKTKKEVQALIATLAPAPDVRSSIRRLPSPQPLPQTATPPASAQGPALIVAAPVDASRIIPPRIPPSAQLQPLSEARHKVQFTASTAVREKLERARALMRHRNVDGDLSIVIERALDLLLAKLEKSKLAATTRPTSRAAEACEVASAPPARVDAREPSSSLSAVRQPALAPPVPVSVSRIGAATKREVARRGCVAEGE